MDHAKDPTYFDEVISRHSVLLLTLLTAPVYGAGHGLILAFRSVEAGNIIRDTCQRAILISGSWVVTRENRAIVKYPWEKWILVFIGRE
jgi:hypothetical protein